MCASNMFQEVPMRIAADEEAVGWRSPGSAGGMPGNVGGTPEILGGHSAGEEPPSVHRGILKVTQGLKGAGSHHFTSIPVG